jgi:carbon-monoxide dehydrogenase small subunit
MDKEPRIYVSMTVNGAPVEAEVPTRESLADFLRHRVGLTGTHVGCEQGICGACTVRFDGRIARSCLTLAAQAHGHIVETIEGMTDSGELASLQATFLKHNAAQCGFCTPGMLVTAAEYLAGGGRADRASIREFLSGNYCRCTGYHAIVDAIEEVAGSKADA